MPVRTALVGYGPAGRLIHRPLLQAEPDIELTHVVTADASRQSEAAADLPGVAVVAGTDALWRRADEYDAVVVASPNDTHLPVSTAALWLGKPVVVDSPLAPTAAEAAGLVRLAERLARPLSVFHPWRWDSDTLTAAALLEDGRLGNVHRLESRLTGTRPHAPGQWREVPERGGGVLMDLGTQLVDQAVGLLGPAYSVTANVATRRARSAVDDDAVLVLQHALGGQSLLWCSWAAPWTGPRLVLHGSRAAWVRQGLDGQLWAGKDGGADPERPPGLLWDERGPLLLPSARADDAAFYRRFAAAVRGEGPVPVAPQDAADVLRVLEGARTSAARGGEVVRLYGPPD